MGWINNVLKGKSKEVVIETHTDFWNWFLANEKDFHKVLKSHEAVEEKFLDPFGKAINQLNEDFYFLAGMYDDDIAELILTADGNLKVIPYLEDLAAEAPSISGWKITTHKPGGHNQINMGDYAFNLETLQFKVNEHPDFPDEIDLTFVHRDYNAEDHGLIENGTFIFLDNHLGEIRSVCDIDSIGIEDSKVFNDDDLVPIEKLNDYLIWREKEFVEKYEGVKHDTENDKYASLEGKTNDGFPLISTVNQTLLQWDAKASHPWFICLDIYYDGKDSNGLPDADLYELLNKMDDDLINDLKDSDGYLNIGRETGNNRCTVFLACKDFRKPVKVLDQLIAKYSNLDIRYSVEKDKYWRTIGYFVKAVS